MASPDEVPHRSRPMPQFPRGKRRAWSSPLNVGEIVVPRVSPQRAAHELRVLMKPHEWTRAAVSHRVGVDAGDPAVEQPWRDDAAAKLLAVAAEAARLLGVEVRAADAGQDRLRLRVEPPDEPATRGVALCCSHASPDLWLTIGRLAVHDRRFWRRERGRKPNYRVAKDVGLTREARAALRDLLRSLPPGKSTPR